MEAILQQLGLDQTFLQIFVLFAVFFPLFSSLVLKPLVELVSERLRRTREERARLGLLQDELEKKKGIEQQKTRQLKLELDALRDAAKREFDTEFSKKLHHVREEIRLKTLESSKLLEQQERKIELEFEKDLPGLRNMAVEKLGYRRSL